jgi:hypothetical protein
MVMMIMMIQLNSFQFFIIYVPSQQLKGQLQTQHSVHTSNYIVEQYNIKSKTNYRQALEKNTLMQKRTQTNEVMVMMIIIVIIKHPVAYLQL